MKRFTSILMAIIMLLQVQVFGENTKALEIDAKSCVLMESSSGKIIYENNKDEKLSPASITKIMTLVLIFDSIYSGKIKLTDMATTSAYAKSMGGSQVFLEEGEIQSVETLIKCIIIASGNDASVVMAEMIAGSEEAFVELMNKKAKELGMNNTHFVDCCGLTDSDEHYTSAKDVALMSRELITKYPEIYKYSTIWQEKIIHKTKAGEKEFVLTNTNKLLKTNQYVKGLKTGSTSKAKYCVSTVAKKDNLELIAVVMAAPDYKTRFNESEKLINYGFANCKVYLDETKLKDVKINNGKKEKLSVKAYPFYYVDTKGVDFTKIIKKEVIYKKLTAPIKKNQTIGYLEYSLNNKVIGKTEIKSKENIKKADYLYIVKNITQRLLQIE